MSKILIVKQCIVLAEAAALIAGIATRKKWASTHFKWLVPYLLFIVLAETAGYYLGYTKQMEALGVLYDVIVIPVEVSFIYWLFYKSPPQKFRKGIVVFWICYLLSLALEYFYFNGPNYVFKSFSYTTGNFFMLILVLRYFVWLTRSDNILTFRTNIMFWLSAGILVFYGGTFIYYGLYNVMARQSLSFFISWTWLALVLNYSMYLLFTIAFVCSKPK